MKLQKDVSGDRKYLPPRLLLIQTNVASTLLTLVLLLLLLQSVELCLLRSTFASGFEIDKSWVLEFP